MKLFLMTIVGIVLCISNAVSNEFILPYAVVTAPVVHFGEYHILSCGNTHVVLDGSKGMSIQMICNSPRQGKEFKQQEAVISDIHLRVSMQISGTEVNLDQAFDSSPRLQIIDQGPGRVAARAFFSLYSADGLPRGSGTLDLYVYEGSIHLVPSMHIDYEADGTFITSAGLFADIPGENAEIIIGGSKLIPLEDKRYVPFDKDSKGFNIMVNNPGRNSMKIGWLRNENPSWLYMRDISTNPEKDELYEKWPPWITQRGALTWVPTPSAGLLMGFAERSLNSLDFLWVNNDSLAVPAGGYQVLNGLMAIFLGSGPSEVQELWKNHEKPIKPHVTAGDFRYYNEIEGIYEVDSQNGEVDASFDTFKNPKMRQVFVRIWNLSGKGAWEVKANNKSIPFGLYNDGDIIEDPMVSIVKQPSGPAHFIGVPLNLAKGSKTRLTVKQRPGLQFTYQMYSELETYEAWSDNCDDNPLFRFHLKRGALYKATLPGKEACAFFKLPLYWLKNGINGNTFMNNTRGFTVHSNGPDFLQFSYTAVNLQGTGLSKYVLTVPYERNSITFDITAEFTPFDDGRRWTSIEYCDLYPFDNVYRRTFHYDDVFFLNSEGEFDRVGTGAWGGRFETVMEPERLGYYANTAKREGQGSRTPDSSDGSLWILGNSPERGNILFRRGDWIPSPGSKSVFSLCNAWVDIHNSIVARNAPGSPETISYTIEVFEGQAPSLEELNALYLEAAGEKTVKQLGYVKYSQEGKITGFIVK